MTASAALGRVLTLVVSKVEAAISALVASPDLILLLRLGNTTRRALYSLSLCTFKVNDSTDLLVLLWSTVIPIVGASFLLIPASYELRRGAYFRKLVFRMSCGTECNKSSTHELISM